VIDENGIVKLIPINVPIQSLSGILYRPGMKSASLEEMETAIKKGAMGRVYWLFNRMEFHGYTIHFERLCWTSDR
jgi:hypothetical protein